MNLFELQLLDWIQANLRCGFLDAVLGALTHLGDGGIFWIILTLLFLILPKTRKAGAAMAISLALESLLCNVLLKPLVARVRPYEINTAVRLLLRAPKDFSFPSGHTGIAFAGAAAMGFARARGRVPALVLASVIGVSRLYLYVHYPTDVLAGAALGVLTGALGVWLVRLYPWKHKLGD